MAAKNRLSGVLVLIAVCSVTSCSRLTSQPARVCPAPGTVTTFLLGMHPDWEVSAYNLVTSLRYPILDRNALDRQLDSLGRRPNTAPGENAWAADVVRANFPSSVFPIFTPRSGLEKLYDRIRDPVRDPVRDLSWPNLARLIRPDLHESLIASFGPECGQVAYDRYSEVSRDGEYQALVAAAFAGQECCTRRGCPPPARSRYGCTGAECRRNF